MPEVAARRLIDAALEGRRYSSWIAAVTDSERAIAQILAETPERSAELEALVRAEHGMFIHDARKAFVSRCRSGIGAYPHGVTLSCVGDNGVRLLVTVLRTERLGRFTEDDLEALTASASTIADRITPSIEVAATSAHPNLHSREQPAFLVLDVDLNVELAWIPERVAHVERLEPGLERLPSHLETVVREMIARWKADEPATLVAGVAVPKATIVMRTMPLTRPGGALRIGLTIEILKTRDTIGAAAREFGLSPRELDVLALLLEGRETRDVAGMLHIAPSTATAHVKRMMLKTNSKNRAELVARALGWQSKQRRA